jgi:uncharacterized membrane protein (UPF0127 family)
MMQIKSFAARCCARVASALLLLASLTLGVPVYAQSQPQVLPTIQLQAGIHVIRAMVADDDQERATGLMFRTEMGPNEGMLFVFDEPGMRCFWMRNTPLPLSAAFIGDDGKVVNIEDMLPFSEVSHCSTGPVRYVLEMHQGWFAKRGIKAGSRLSGRPFR